METCAILAREGVLALLAFAGRSQELGPVTAQGLQLMATQGSWPESRCSQPGSCSYAWEQLAPLSLGPLGS